MQAFGSTSREGGHTSFCVGGAKCVALASKLLSVLIGSRKQSLPVHPGQIMLADTDKHVQDWIAKVAVLRPHEARQGGMNKF